MSGKSLNQEIHLSFILILKRMSETNMNMLHRHAEWKDLRDDLPATQNHIQVVW